MHKTFALGVRQNSLFFKLPARAVIPAIPTVTLPAFFIKFLREFDEFEVMGLSLI